MENRLNDLGNAIDLAMNNEKTASENPFPIDVFPKVFKDLVIDYYKTINYPIDYTASAILTAVSTAIGTTAKVKVINGWYEYASLYCCIVGNAGANKTHPICKVFEPIKAIDKINHDLFSVAYKEFEQYEKLSKKVKDEQTEIIKPTLTKSVLTNFTPEILNKRLNENPRGCTILSDELETFFEGMNNYSKSNQLSTYLSIWNNQSVTIDRISEPVPLFILKPYLCVIGGLQPRMLSKSFPKEKLNNGFYQRFLFAYPEVSLKKPLPENESNKVYFESYKNMINKLFNDLTFNDELSDCKIFGWTDEAKAFFKDWQKNNCDLVNDNQNNIKGEIIGKFDNHFVRLSLLLQLMKDINGNLIQLEAVQGAKLLCDYFMNCSFKVLEVIQNPIEYFKSINENKRYFYNSLSDNFTTAEAIALGSGFELIDRRVKEFLNDTILFKKVKHGSYSKKIKSEK